MYFSVISFKNFSISILAEVFRWNNGSRKNILAATVSLPVVGRAKKDALRSKIACACVNADCTNKARVSAFTTIAGYKSLTLRMCRNK